MKITFLITNQHKYKWAMNLIEAIQTLGHELKVYRANKTLPWQLNDQDLVISHGYEDIVPEDKPTMVLEWGFIDRLTPKNPDGYLQVCPSKIANIVSKPVKSDRNRRVFSQVKIDQEAPVLILGQKERDKQHNMTYGQLKAYYNGIIDKIREESPEKEIWFRNHPSSLMVHEFPGVANMDQGPVEDLIPKVSKVYTFNSTGGLAFLEFGIPVEADPSCYYHEVGKNPNEKNVFDLFSRLGYSQWSVEELGSPSTVKELLTYCQTGNVPESWVITPKPISISPPKVSTPPILPPSEPLAPSEFEISTAYAILQEQDFYKRKKLFKQMWPGVKCSSKKDILSHCEAIMKHSKEI